MVIKAISVSAGPMVVVMIAVHLKQFEENEMEWKQVKTFFKKYQFQISLSTVEGA